ncbi:cation diffusion facilitator family transporter [Galenea microaerophila]
MSGHHHHHQVSGKNLFITIVLNIIITLSQIIGGIVSGSLSLLSDAVHNFSDVLALVIAYVANKLALKQNTKDKTFGYKRAEIIAALFNASILMGISVFLIVEALRKFYHPEPIESLWVIALGTLSIVLNVASVLLVKDDAHNNMNIKAAYLHLLTDVMTSVAVVVGGLLMYAFHIVWVDPLISMLIALYLIWASFGLVKESIAILMQFTPKEVDIDAIVTAICQIPEIENVHHIHVWKLDDHRIFLEAHLDFNENISLQAASEILDQLETMLEEKFGISHTTFQSEYHRCHDKAMIKKK